MKIALEGLVIKLLAASLLGISLGAWASNRPDNITDAERAMLPPYCPYTMGEKGHIQPHIGKWVGVMGDGFFAMHHHCWALIDFHRAERSGLSATYRRLLWDRALGGFSYVVRNTRDDFILLPEIFTWIGRTEILLEHPVNAANAFAKARALKPDYWPAYYHWATFLQSKGKKSDALEVTKSGLQYSPNAKALLLLFGELGGKTSDLPPPVVSKGAEAESAREPENSPPPETPAAD